MKIYLENSTMLLDLILDGTVKKIRETLISEHGILNCF